MKVSTTLSVFLLGCMTFAAALPAETGEPTRSVPAAPTATASPPDNPDSESKWSDIIAVPETDANSTDRKAATAIKWGLTMLSYPVAGNGAVTFNSAGLVRSEYHLRNLDPNAPATYVLVCALRDAKPGMLGHIWWFAHTGLLQPAGRPGDHVDSDKPSFNLLVRQFWPNIVASGEDLRCGFAANVNANAMIIAFLKKIKSLGPFILPLQRIIF